MRTSLPPPLRRNVPLLALAALAALAAAVPLLAQAGDTALPALGFPIPVWLALIVAGLCGAVGAFAADLVTDGGRIEQWRRDEAGWSLGFFAKMVIGLVAAIVFLTLNPPGDSWPSLVGSALVAGLGGEAILLAVIASRRAQEMEHRAEEVIARLEGVPAIVRAAGRERMLVPNDGGAALFADEAQGSTLQEVVDAYVDNAVAEVRRRAGRAIAQ